MRSIREVCSKDHTLAEIQAWGGRPYDEARRRQIIAEHRVWVVQRAGIDPLIREQNPNDPIHLEAPEPADPGISGWACLGLKPATDIQPARWHIYALYLGSEVLGLGLGRELVRLMLEEAQREGATEVTLESTITAHGFYKHCGFVDEGPMTTVEINGERIRCFPMSLRFNEVVPVPL